METILSLMINLAMLTSSLPSSSTPFLGVSIASLSEAVYFEADATKYSTDLEGNVSATSMDQPKSNIKGNLNFGLNQLWVGTVRILKGLYLTQIDGGVWVNFKPGNAAPFVLKPKLHVYFEINQPVGETTQNDHPLLHSTHDHWFLGTGLISSTIQISSINGTTSEQQTVIILSSMTKLFQGLMVFSQNGERWLRQGKTVYRWSPVTDEVIALESRPQRENAFMNSALSVKEFLFGFDWKRYSVDSDATHGDETLTLLASDDRASYAKIKIDLNEKNQLQRAKFLNHDGALIKSVEVQSFATFNGSVFPKVILIKNILTGVTTKITIQRRSQHAVPNFVFTPQALKTFTITEE